MTAAARNHALDLLRGLTIALMIIVNNPGDWKAMFTVLRHAEWHGFLGADIVFPLFLFVSGFAAALKIDRLTPLAGGPHCASALSLEETESKPYYLPLLRRAAILFGIGLFLNAWPFGLLPGTEFHPENWRVLGVLQRIALCAFFGGLLLWKIRSLRGMILALALLAALYEIGMRLPLIETPEAVFGRNFDLKYNFARWVDIRLIPEAMLYKVQKIPFDPEGLFTTITALMTFLIGGLAYRVKHVAPGQGANFLCIGLVVLGGAFAFFEPVNKSLWTLPYVLLTGAVAVLLLGLLEKMPSSQQGWIARLSRPILYLGMNPLFIYVLSGIVGKALAVTKTASGLSLKATLFNSMQILHTTPEILSLIYSLGLLTFLAILARALKHLPLAAR
jgi:predicted acyltransferase